MSVAPSTLAEHYYSNSNEIIKKLAKWAQSLKFFIFFSSRGQKVSKLVIFYTCLLELGPMLKRNPSLTLPHILFLIISKSIWIIILKSMMPISHSISNQLLYTDWNSENFVMKNICYAIKFCYYLGRLKSNCIFISYQWTK